MRSVGSWIGAAALVWSIGAGAAGEAALKVTSSAFSNNGNIPVEYTCDGRGFAPPLTWSAVPSGTKSIAVLVDDPDAPSGDFVHLAVYNLPPERRSLPTEAIKSIAPGSAMQSARNSGGTVGFAPICPPSGRHHYKFEVLALDTALQIPPASDAQAIRAATQGHVLARGELVGVYGKRGED
jgi:Raf kinase inhibitor-like YbhB/YbcL family protein